MEQRDLFADGGGPGTGIVEDRGGPFGLGSVARRRAVTDAARLPVDHGLLQSLADALPWPMFVVDQSLRIAFCNRRGRELLDDASSALKAESEFLSAENAGGTSLIRNMVATIVDEAGTHPLPATAESAGCALMREGALPLLLVGRSLPSATTGRVSVALFVVDAGLRQAPTLALMRSMFDLTEAEARLASAVVSGHGLSWAARVAGMTVNTAHTHLGHVFDKTGTRRQAELVKLLLSLPADAGAARDRDVVARESIVTRGFPGCDRKTRSVAAIPPRSGRRSGRRPALG